MAASGNLEDLKLKIFLARRQPWWRLTRFGPSNIRNVPTPLKNLIHRAPQYALSMLIAAGIGCETVRRGQWKHAKLSFPSFVLILFYHSASSLRFEDKFLLLRPQINF